jgi:Mlc titration factor MtfA (ptsG expression regulator)
MAPHVWKRTMLEAYEDFEERVERGERTDIDPYAAESPAEFFAVLSEVFFVEPALLRHEYPAVYRQFASFYRQDPAARVESLRKEQAM